MEEQCSDPYEQQLFAVFESCLVDGQTDLRIEGLRSLCEKLQLDDAGKNVILKLLHQEDASKTSVSFREFRNGLLELLDKSQEKAAEQLEKDQQIISDGGEFKQNSYRSTNGDNKLMTIKYQHQQLDEYINDHIFEKRKINEFWNDHARNVAVNGADKFLIYGYNKVSSMTEQEKSRGDQLTCAWSGKSQSELMDGKLNDVICGSQHAGCMPSNSIFDMWEMAGIQDASTLLSDLGFEMPHVNVGDLTNVLLDELKSQHEEPADKVAATHIKLLKCTLCLFQEQNRHLSNLTEHLSFERDKLRSDVMEWNDRANSLAHEIDEGHARMEKCRQEQLKQLESKHAEITKELMNQLNAEREKSSSAIQVLDRQLQNSQLEEQRIKNELANMSRETRELETENQILSSEISKLRSFNDQLTAQVERLAAQHEEVINAETEENKHIVDLMDHVKHLKSEIAVLRDHNDELTTELEYYKRNEKERNEKEKNDLYSYFTSREVNPIGSAMQRSLSDTVNESECFASSHRESVNSVENQDKEMKNVENVDQSLPDDSKLSCIRSAILKTVQQLRHLAKQQPCSEHCTLRLELSSILATLETQLPFLKDSAESDHPSPKIDKVRVNLQPGSSEDTKISQKNKNTGLRDYPPRKEEQSPSSSRFDVAKGLQQLLSEKAKDTDHPNQKLLDFKLLEDFLRERDAKLSSEKKQVLDRCAELEKSLEMLKMEYEECEDYWTAKLEEEREIFEQEQKISDDKFAELINKMTEYEEQFSSTDKGRSEGRLTPIEETVNLEQQYADLEEEFDKWKLQSQEEIESRDREISELRGKLLNKQVATSDVSLQYPEDSAVIQNLTQSSSTPFSYHSLDSAGTFDASPRDFVDGGIKVPGEPEGAKKRPDGARSRRSRQSASSADCSDQMETDISFDDVRWLIKKKTDIGFECKALRKQREKLRHEVQELQDLKELNELRVMSSAMDAGTMQALYMRIQAQDQRQKDLMACIRHQQQDTTRLLQKTWKQHHSEITDLKLIIHTTKEQLEQQISVNKEQADRLTRADQLSKELFMENTHLLESIKRLEQHCQILSQCNTECTSV